MKAILMSRAKKWMILALIGCSAYFAGYILGQDAQKAPITTPPEIQTPR
ncbi:hypothetical protein [Bdellovibrio sp. HCB274]